MNLDEFPAINPPPPFSPLFGEKKLQFFPKKIRSENNSLSPQFFLSLSNAKKFATQNLDKKPPPPPRPTSKYFRKFIDFLEDRLP